MQSSVRSLRPSPAMIVAMVALVAALSGAAIAGTNKATVKSSDIKKGAVTKQKIANGAVTKKKLAKGSVGSQQIIGKSIKGNRIKDGGIKDKQIADATISGAKIADGAITGPKVADDSLNDTKMSDYDVIGNAGAVRLTATEAASEAAARTAAPETPLFSKGGLEIYAKCFRDTTAGVVYGEIYARTSANGAIIQGNDTLPSGNATLLDTNTPEVDRTLDSGITSVANAGDVSEAEGVLISADGATDLTVITHVATKQGTFAGGNGAFGDGNVCLFGGSISG